MTLPALTKGSLLDIYREQDIEKPICQVLGVKKLGSSDRYRILLSDGLYISGFTMLATQMNHIIEEGVLTDFSIIEIGRYVLSNANNGGKPRRIMVLLDVTQKVAGSEVGGKIGNPTNLEQHLTLDSAAEATSENHSAAPPSSSANTAAPAQRTLAAPIQRQPQKKRLNETINAGEQISTTPIAALSPYHNRWVIKARVGSKSDVRTWSNARGEGKLFNCNLVDESGEIRCTGFKEAVDKFFDLIEVGKCYYVSRCTLKPANRAFNNTNNEYEMTMQNDTEIIVCDDNLDDVPLVLFNFIPIKQVASCPKDDFVDILGVLKEAGPAQVIVSRAKNKEFTKRDLYIVDTSNTMITLTLWGTQAENFDGTGNPIIAAKGVKVATFNNGISVGALSSSVIQMDPDIPEAHKLRQWWSSTGSSQNAESISRGFEGNFSSPWMTFKEALTAGKTIGDKPEYYQAKATIAFVRSENALYKACPLASCNKKVVDHEGSYRCEKCAKNYPNFKWRLILSLNIADYSGSTWVTTFNDDAEKLIGRTAGELGELAEEDKDTYSSLCANAAFSPYIVKVRMLMEHYMDALKLKSTVQKVLEVDYEEYNQHLLTKLKESVRKSSN